MISTLARWNRWGTGALDPGRPRGVTSTLGPFLRSKEVIGVVGPRRAGKTTVLHQILDRLIREGAPPASTLHVNFEDPAFATELGPGLLDRIYSAYREEVFPSGPAWLFFDEIQCLPGWERWVRTRMETEAIKVFVTGSSSALMSRELGTLLTGRHVAFKVLPLSFAEYLAFREIAVPPAGARFGTPPAIQHALNDYLKFGGFPEVVLARVTVRKETLLRQYFDDILFKDVALRHEVRDLTALRALAAGLLNQTASLVTYQRLARTHGISVDLARAYCSHLRECFLIDLLPIYSLKATERNRNPQKVHALDTGLRNTVCLSGSEDRGRLMESAVWAALARTTPDGIFYARTDGEIDLAELRGTRIRRLIQVCADPEASAETLAREIRPLTAAIGIHPKARRQIVTHRSIPPERAKLVESVEVVPLWRFLLDPD